MADVGNLVAKLTLDTAGFDKAIGGVSGSVGKLASGITGALSGVTAAVGAAVTAAAAGIGAIVKESISSFAEYEQLVGGVETLFKESAGIVQDYAVQAYKTAGISANQYMEQATSFSARLIQALDGDTEKAAKLTDKAIIDMSDNANKMGTDIQSIQNAYQGFAKANYTMLDNLKLGYGGTKEEMQRLLEDAEKLTGIHYDIEQFDDIIEAIHAIQENLGITGTTAEEAATTISGSLNMVKASWNDLLTSISGGGIGVSEAINNLVESAEAFIGNIMPVIEEALYGIGDLIQGIAPIIAERLPELISTLVPMLLETAMYLVTSLVEVLPQLVATIAEALINIIPQLVEAVISLLDTLLTSIIPLILEVGIALILALGQGIADNVSYIMNSIIILLQFMVNMFLENLPMILDIGLQIILALVEGLLMNINPLTDMIVQLIGGIVQTIVENIPLLLEMGLKIGLALVEGILLAIPSLLVSIGRFFGIIDDAQNEVSKKGKSMKSDMDFTFNSIVTNANEASEKVSSASKDMSIATEQTSKETYDYSRDVIEHTQDASRMATDALTKIHVAFEGMVDFSRETKRTVEEIASSINTVVDKGIITPLIDKFNRLKDYADSILRYVIQTINKINGLLGGIEKESQERLNFIMENIANTAKSVTNSANQALEQANIAANAAAEAAAFAAEAATSAAEAIASAAEAASAASSFGGGRASGGPVSAGTTYLVGEQGPELFMPKSNGYVIDAEETANLFSGGRGDIVINIQGDVYDDERSMRNKMKAAIIDVLEEQVAYG